MWLLVFMLAQAQDVNAYLLWRGEPALPPGPQALVAVAPVFPSDLTTKPDGEVVALDVELGPEGLVKRAAIVGGPVTAHTSAMRAIIGWRFQAPSSGPSGPPLRVVFVYRTMPAGTPPDQLTTVFRGKYEVEVRRVVGAEPQNNEMQRTKPAQATELRR